MRLTDRQFRGLEAATCSADEYPWAMMGELPAGDLKALVAGGVLAVVGRLPLDVTAPGTMFTLTAAGVGLVKERMALITATCTHPAPVRGVCPWCGAFLGVEGGGGGEGQ